MDTCQLLGDLGMNEMALTSKQLRPTKLYGDNLGCNALTRNPEFHQRTKHIALRQRFISSLEESGTAEVDYIPSNTMLTDGMTTPLHRDKHEMHWEMMGLTLNFELKKTKRKFDDISH